MANPTPTTTPKPKAPPKAKAKAPPKAKSTSTTVKPGGSSADQAAAEIAARLGYVPSADPGQYMVDDNWEILLGTIPGRSARPGRKSVALGGYKFDLGGGNPAVADKAMIKKRNDLFDALYNDETFQEEVGISVAELQQRMFLAGFYGNASWEDVIPGQPDAATQRAFDQLLDISGRAYKVGSPATLLQVLDKFMGAGISAGRNLKGGGSGGKTRPPIALPGPEEIAQAVKSTVASLLGREPDQAELDGLANVLTGFSKDTATQQQNLAVAADGSQQVVNDPQSQFKEYLEQKYKPEITRNQDVKGLSTGRDNLLKTVLSLDQMMGR